MPARVQTPTWALHVPNMLSGCRLLLALAFPVVPAGWRLVFVVAGGLSDFLDGFLARRLNARTTLGGLLDAIADKLFTLSVLLTLAADGVIAWWQILLVLLRDLAVGGIAASAALRRDRHAFDRIVARLPGKLTTALVLLWFLAVLLQPGSTATLLLFGLTVACSGFAAVDYLRQFVLALRADRTDAGHSRILNKERTESGASG